MHYSTFNLLALLPFATAHFTLNWPTARGFDDTQAGSFPCGGFDEVKSPRTEFPLGGGPLQLNLEHTSTQVAVYLSLGSDPGNNYNIVLRPQFKEQGPGDFCLGEVGLPSSLNITSGTNGTIQVVTNGHAGGGLYQCADVTFTNITLSQSDNHCANNTNVKVTQENMPGNPNGTSSGTGTSSETPGPNPSSAAAHATAAGWLLGAVGAAGLALL
ncbi:unnamed protein product [Periconia digitata]|uniref:Copper acquisition factor BIM1-like domain-containing protein n=1 Tax=Periconia digitata TaxID=1303443 RepID=A0A9W4XY85_9PLEO|nr:unnamed protein product [Periconia digitata]